jgi:23S rRNA pseudouridine1911/1915/1917 synthase
MPPVEIFVSRREKDSTVASVLHGRLGLSWARVKKIIEGRHILIGGQVEANPARRCRAGLRIVVAAGVLDPKPGAKQETGKPVSRDAKRSVKKGNAEFGIRNSESKPKKKTSRESLPTTHASRLTPHDPDLVYVDSSVVVVNKPIGLTTMRHEDEAEEFGKGKRFLPKTLADLLPGLLGEPGRPVIAVHRIDRDTSGLVVFARTAAAAKHLTDQFRKHTADRRYLALVRGTPKAGRIESELVRDRGDGRRGSGTGDDAKRAVTHIKVIEPLGQFAAVECRLETGRTHQVRIHLGEAGTPLCGETVYDRPLNGKPYPDGSKAKRPMLHATRLGFVHPETKEQMSWDVPPPGDFAELWVTLREQGRETS